MPNVDDTEFEAIIKLIVQGHKMKRKFRTVKTMNLEFKLVKLGKKTNGCVRYFLINIRERCSLTSAMVERDCREQTVVPDFNNYLKTKLGKIKIILF
jgi:hypothetical protein